MSSDFQDVDVFDSILNLEDQYYEEGYALGVADGARAGRIEGRVFGLEKGFERFLEMGKLGGRAAVWSARLPTSSLLDDVASEPRLPQLKASHRLKKHVERLSALTDPEDFSTENSEEGVSEVDDRLKDSHIKATLIAKILGEDDAAARDSKETPATGIASNTNLRVRRDGDSAAIKGRSQEMEDFSGLPR